MTPEELKNLIKKYQLGQCTDKEKEWIEQWLESLQARSDELTGTEEARIKHTLRERIQTAIAEEEAVIPLPVARFSLWKAASVLLFIALAGAAFLWLGKSNLFKTQVAYMEIYNPPGRQKIIQLSDHSRVYMNADTRIRVPRSFSGDIRQVYLEGEAFFEVTKNPAKPFVITTGNVHTRVLGTSFTVRAYQDEPHIEVVVRTGKVRVGDSTNAVFLTPSQKAIYNRKDHHLAQMNTANPEDYLAWMDGKLVFEEKTLPEIIQVLNRKYNVSIQLENPDLSRCVLNARFKNEPLQRVLEKICLYLGARYKKTDNRIFISGNKCQ